MRRMRLICWFAGWQVVAARRPALLVGGGAGLQHLPGPDQPVLRDRAGRPLGPQPGSHGDRLLSGGLLSLLLLVQDQGLQAAPLAPLPGGPDDDVDL